MYMFIYKNIVPPPPLSVRYLDSIAYMRRDKFVSCKNFSTMNYQAGKLSIFLVNRS